MWVDFLEGFLGLALVGMTLRDVFETVVVPGGSKASLHVARRLRRLLLPLWRRLRPSKGMSSTFAPVLLVGSFAIWAGLLMLGFALMLHPLQNDLRPAPASFADALYLAASSVVTLGIGNTTASGTARWVVVGGGLCGLCVITMAVTYLLEVQSGVGDRDVGILKLNTSAGDPTSALTLLETYAALGSQRELGPVLKEARDWCTTVWQSHSAHPSLIYFRSTGTGAGWPAAVGAMLDLSLIVSRILDADELRGAALLLRADALHMAEALGRLVGLQPALDEVSEDDVSRLRQRLAEAGYPLRDEIDVLQLLHERSVNMVWVKAMADHLGKACSPFVPEPGAAG